MESYGLSKASVINLLEAHGVTLRRQPMSEEQVEEATTLYLGGYSLSALQRELNASRETIRRALIDAGVQMRSRGGATRSH